MKLQPDRLDMPSITAHGPGWVAINGEKKHQSVVIGSQGELFDWDCSDFANLTASHFAALCETQPELVLFGSGDRLRFPAPQLLHALMARRIGVETMDTAAACRTYNILAGEGRKVVAALLIEKVP